MWNKSESIVSPLTVRIAALVLTILLLRLGSPGRSSAQTGALIFVTSLEDNISSKLYKGHYFQSALDLTVCVRDTDQPNQRGFYLITLKGSQQAGLTGIKGGIVRHVAVGKTRSSLERALATIKQTLEATPD